MNQPEYVIRSPKAEDAAFILATVLRGLYYGDTWFSSIDKSLFMKEQHKVLVATMSRPDCAIKIACLPDDTDVILGYSITLKNESLVWVFVKSAFRKMGIARSLVPPTITAVTYLTRLGSSILKKHPNVQFNPYLNS